MMELHASGEDYLETILILQKQCGMVRSVDVARQMSVSKPSVCRAVAVLRDGGFLEMDEDHFLYLTDAGRKIAEEIYTATGSLRSGSLLQVLIRKQRKPMPVGWSTRLAVRALLG